MRGKAKACGVPLLGLCLLALASGCSSGDERVRWSVEFACAADGERAVEVEIGIAPGDCTSIQSSVFEARVDRGTAPSPPAPGSLPSGSYAFYSRAFDGDGQQVASDCATVMLPTSDPVALLLASEGGMCGSVLVDCGGPNGAACETCDDGIRNGGEVGVDCGGPCSVCSGCHDGKQSDGETSVDCGGPCNCVCTRQLSTRSTPFLGVCEGHCSHDSDCSGNLKCFRTTDNLDQGFLVPGCLGVLTSNTNYCYDPVALGITRTLDFVDRNGQELGECKGDCDGDGNCNDGLFCWGHEGAEVSVPGCLGVDTLDGDYCVNRATYERINCN